MPEAFWTQDLPKMSFLKNIFSHRISNWILLVTDCKSATSKYWYFYFPQILQISADRKEEIWIMKITNFSILNRSSLWKNSRKNTSKKCHFWRTFSVIESRIESSLLVTDYKSETSIQIVCCPKIHEKRISLKKKFWRNISK